MIYHENSKESYTQLEKFALIFNELRQDIELINCFWTFYTFFSQNFFNLI